MNQRVFLYRFLIVFFFFPSSLAVFSQGLEPVLSEGDSSLIFLEAEDAVSTNFTTTATLNYGTSGSKALQLDTQAWLQAGSLYYTEWVFYVEEDGTYDLWYGGTPPGPRGDLLPSYASPFRVSLDGVILKECYREDVQVGESYTPSYYWVKTGQMWMAAGIHRIRFEIIGPRQADSKFYFFLDNIFLANTAKAVQDFRRETEPALPALEMEGEITEPFQETSYYQEIIEENPEDVDAALELARINTFLEDYVGALSILRRILPFDVENQEILNLTAKNRLWKGDLSQALSIFRQALDFDPLQEMRWVEAGKIGGWSGQINQGIEVMEEGLVYFPDSINLKVNIALLHYWKSDPAGAQEILRETREGLIEDPDGLLEMGELLEINGYPAEALKIILRGRELFPTYLDFYFREISLYLKNRELGDPEEVYSLIESAFNPSPELSRAVSLYREKQGMKQLVIDEYEEKISEEPDNLLLREALVQALFWNGMKSEAVAEYKNILINETFHKLRELELNSLPLLELIDTIYSLQPALDFYPARASDLRNRLRNGRSAWSSAQRAAERKPEDTALAAALEEQSEELGAVLAEAETFLYEYDYLVSEISRATEDAGFYLEEEKADADNFKLLIGDLDWVWDREYLLYELEEGIGREKELSPWILGRVYHYFGNFEESAAAYLMRQGDTAFDLTVFGLYELYLWSGDEERRQKLYEDYGESIDLYCGYTSFLEGLSTEMVPTADAGSGYFSGEADEAERVETLLGGVQLVSLGISSGKSELSEAVRDLKSVMEKRLERSFFYITQDTAVQRFQLGDYLLEMGDNPGASDQFEQVLMVDPWNITATYNLGVVRQRYQDWSGAMKNYRKVFYQNPDFENAAAYYNQLARAHSDSFDTEFIFSLDNSVLSLDGTGVYSAELNTWFGLDLEYNFHAEHIYRTYNYESNTSYLTQEMLVSFPMILPNWGLEIIPTAGGILWSTYFGQSFYYPSDYKVPLSDFFLTVSARPELGVSAEWAEGPFSVTAGYDRFIKQESIHPDRDVTAGHRASAAFETYFLFPESPRLSLISTNTYGELEFMDDGNLLAQASQAGWLDLALLRDPGVNLRVNLNVNYEDSEFASDGDYFTPSEILEAKGGLKGTLNLHTDDYSNLFEMSLWGTAGGYWTDVSTEESRTFALKTEGSFSLYFTRNSKASLYATLYGAGNFTDADFSDVGYWQFSFTLGLKSRMPNLLTD